MPPPATITSTARAVSIAPGHGGERDGRRDAGSWASLPGGAARPEAPAPTACSCCAADEILRRPPESIAQHVGEVPEHLGSRVGEPHPDPLERLVVESEDLGRRFRDDVRAARLSASGAPSRRRSPPARRRPAFSPRRPSACRTHVPGRTRACTSPSPASPFRMASWPGARDAASRSTTFRASHRESPARSGAARTTSGCIFREREVPQRDEPHRVHKDRRQHELAEHGHEHRQGRERPNCAAGTSGDTTLTKKPAASARDT